jgi:hypothetical protein
MIGEFKFFSKNNGEDVFNTASMRNICGVQYRNLIYNDYTTHSINEQLMDY